MNSFTYDLGDEVKDRITGFKGIIVSRSDYMTGCNRYSVQSKELIDGKPIKWQGFDEAEIILVKAKAVEKKNPKRPGGSLSHDPQEKTR